MDSSDDDFDGDFNNPYDNAAASLRNLKTVNNPFAKLPLKYIKPSIISDVIDLSEVPISFNSHPITYPPTNVSEVVEINDNVVVPEVLLTKPKRKSKKPISHDIQTSFAPTPKRRCSKRISQRNGVQVSPDVEKSPTTHSETSSIQQEMSLAHGIVSTSQALFNNHQGSQGSTLGTQKSTSGTSNIQGGTSTSRQAPIQRSGQTTRGRGRKKRQPVRRYLTPDIPTYSVGNTAEYDDAMEKVPLFVNIRKEAEVNMDAERESEFLCEDINEELTVKVHWRHMNFFKFCLRRYQKFKIIFEFFADKDKVAPERILLTLCDRVLSPDDSPEVVGYNIKQFIEGGILSEGVTLQQSEEITNTSGILLKFQCENRKRQFKFNVPENKKLQTAMIRCAEEFEVPMSKLKFYFDGDLLMETNTPQELELEGGECIDVVVQK